MSLSNVKKKLKDTVLFVGAMCGSYIFVYIAIYISNGIQNRSLKLLKNYNAPVEVLVVDHPHFSRTSRLARTPDYSKLTRTLNYSKIQDGLNKITISPNELKILVNSTIKGINDLQCAKRLAKFINIYHNNRPLMLNVVNNSKIGSAALLKNIPKYQTGSLSLAVLEFQKNNLPATINNGNKQIRSNDLVGTINEIGNSKTENLESVVENSKKLNEIFLVSESITPSKSKVVSKSKTQVISKNKKLIQKDCKFLIGMGGSLEFFDTFCSGPVNTIDHETLANLEQNLQTFFRVRINIENLRGAIPVFHQLADVFLQSIFSNVDFRAINMQRVELTRFRSTDSLGNLSGVSIVNRENQVVPLSRESFSQFFATPESYRQAQRIIYDFHAARHALTTTNVQQPILNQIQDNLHNAYNQVAETGLFNREQIVHINPTNNIRRIIKMNPSAMDLQVYAKLPGIDLNAAGSFNYLNRTVSIGVGKAFFMPLDKISSNFGLIAGLDSGVKFNYSNNSVFNYCYGGLTFKAFLGLGFNI